MKIYFFFFGKLSSLACSDDEDGPFAGSLHAIYLLDRSGGGTRGSGGGLLTHSTTLTYTCEQHRHTRAMFALANPTEKLGQSLVEGSIS